MQRKQPELARLGQGMILLWVAPSIGARGAGAKEGERKGLVQRLAKPAAPCERRPENEKPPAGAGGVLAAYRIALMG